MKEAILEKLFQDRFFKNSRCILLRDLEMEIVFFLRFSQSATPIPTVTTSDLR